MQSIRMLLYQYEVNNWFFVDTKIAYILHKSLAMMIQLNYNTDIIKHQKSNLPETA
jgi:hypothetical protein